MNERNRLLPQLLAAPWLLTVIWLLLVGGSGANITEPASLSVVSMHTGDQPLFTSLVVHTPGAEGSAVAGSPDELQHVSQTQHWPYTASLSPTQVVGTEVSEVSPPEISTSTTAPKTTPAMSSTAATDLQYLRGQHQRQMQTLYHQMRHLPPEYSQILRDQLQEKQRQQQQQLQQQQLQKQQQRRQQKQQRQEQQQKQRQQQEQQQKQQQLSTAPPISSLLLTRGNALFFLNDVDGSSSPSDQLQSPAEVVSPSGGRDAFDHAKALGNSDTFHQSDAMPATTPMATTPPPAPSLTSPPASPLQSMPYRQQLQKPHSWPPQPVASQQHREQQQLQLQSSSSRPQQPQASQSTEQQLQLQQLKNPHSPPRESPQPQSTGQQLQGQKLRVKQKHRSNRHRHNKQRPSSSDHSSVSSVTDFEKSSGGARVPPPPTFPQLGGRWDVSTQQLSTQQLAPQQLPPQLGAPAGSFVAQLPLTPGSGPDAATVPALIPARLVTAAPQFASSPYLSSSSGLQMRPPVAVAVAQAQTRTPQPYHQAAAQNATAEAPHHSVRQPPAYPHHEYQHQQPALGPQHQSPVSTILTAPAHAAAYSPAVSSVTTAPVHAAHTYLQTVAAAALQQQQPSVVPQTLHEQLYHDSPLHSGVVVFPEEARQQLYQQVTTPVPPISRPNPHHHGPLHNGAILVSHVPRQHEHQQSQVYYNGGILLPEVLRKYLYPNQVNSIAPLHINSPRDHYHQQNLVQHGANLGQIQLRQQPYHHIQVQGSATQLSDVPRQQPYQQGNVHHIATLGSDILRLQPHQQGPLNNGAATRQHPHQLSPVNSAVRSTVPNSAAASSGRVVVSVEPAIVKSLSYQQTAVVPEQKPPLHSSGTSSSVYQSPGGQHIQMITAVPSQSTILLPVSSNVHHTSPHLATTYVRPLQTSNNVVQEPQHMMSDNGFRISHDKHAAIRGYTGASPVSVIYRSSIGVTSPNNRAPHRDGAGRPQRHNNDLQTPVKVDLRPPPPVIL
ncbi:mediator of RNA polymerase II transcription subunit 15-like [Schistocerca piceifrons]|uniref:mediator of RNA polymerase II transcription subunit 15-like n=1 Tax=Schistocerca piceifrons TaxID=274613 RepID=UPI001F5FEE23|nr:mediator of RNA polymerase II transcription subunit 15-like [Schistocerca piceifrons]